MQRLFTYSLIGFAILSCEKVIDIPLNEADRKIVVEAELKDNGENWIRLKKTGSVYEDSEYEDVWGATIKVTDKDANEYVFTDGSFPGGYSCTGFPGVEPNNSYDLEILADGLTITGHAKTPDRTYVDSIYYELVENVFGAFFGDTTDSVLIVKYQFQDDASKQDYYIRRSYVNGGDYTAVAFNDGLWNGQVVDGTMSNLTPNYGDTIFTELMSVDKSVYDFFESLSANTTSNVSPANPVSNISSNALGYFGVFVMDTITLIIPE